MDLPLKVRLMIEAAAVVAVSWEISLFGRILSFGRIRVISFGRSLVRATIGIFFDW